MVTVVEPVLNGNGHRGKDKPATFIDVDKVLEEITIHEKVALLGGKDTWHLNDLPHRGISSIRLSDGPNGCRGTQFFNGTGSSCFPCATGVAASFDLALVNDIGVQLGDECRAKGVHVLLGPTVNIQRSPLAGRGFEMFSEDPLLSGKVAAEYVKGVQSRGVAATLKHFVGNEQEHERMKADSIIPERALREIYLEPFRIVTKEADPKCYMTGYNKLNGTHCSENSWLLDEVLRKEWGYDGLVMSDWTGTVSCTESIKAGLDLEMPGPPAYRGACTLRDVQTGKLSAADIDGRARKVLQLYAYAQQSGIPFDHHPPECIDTPAVRALLRDAAANAVVLLKNDNNVLPIRAAKRIAVIGPNARVAVTSGGGSAQLVAAYSTSPLQGITEAARSLGATVEYSIGSLSYHFLPIATPLLSIPNTTVSGNGVAQIDFWLQEPTADFRSPLSAPSGSGSSSSSLDIDVVPDHSLLSKTAFAFMTDNVPDEILSGFPFIQFTSLFTPDQSGDWKFSIASVDQSLLYINDELVADNSIWEQGETFFGMGSKEKMGTVRDLTEGVPVKVTIRSWAQMEQRGFPIKLAGGVRLGALPIFDDDKAISDAVKIAQAADVAIVVVGLNEDFESEGHDRKVLSLPGTSDKLVHAVLAVRPDAVIVTQSGMPIAMPWEPKAATIVHAFYGGNDLGTGLADVLFGLLNPSSRLPVTFPCHLEDTPSGLNFGIASPSSLKAHYQEDIFVGYRHFDRAPTEEGRAAPLFPFGHGLSYTTFKYSNLSVSSPQGPNANFTVEFGITNTGSVAGAEVTQVYIRQLDSTTGTEQERPPKELKSFAKCFLEPGETLRLTLGLDREAFKFWDDVDHTWVAQRGAFEIIVGQSSAKTVLSTTVLLQDTLKWIGL